jgi:hypothetical protein
VAVRQLDQIGGGFRDEGRRLFRAALTARLILSRTSAFARRWALAAALCLFQSTSESVYSRKVRLLRAQL